MRSFRTIAAKGTVQEDIGWGDERHGRRSRISYKSLRREFGNYCQPKELKTTYALVREVVGEEDRSLAQVMTFLSIN
jgi:hypothetical protein